MSASSLCRLFKQALGITPRAYADACRRRRFRAALRSGAEVLDASLDAGYGSSSRLYEDAGGHLGMTPGTYRNGGKGQRITCVVTESALGWLLLAATGLGICAVKLGDESSALMAELRREFPHAELCDADPQLRAWSESLVQYLSGRLPCRSCL